MENITVTLPKAHKKQSQNSGLRSTKVLKLYDHCAKIIGLRLFDVANSAAHLYVILLTGFLYYCILVGKVTEWFNPVPSFNFFENIITICSDVSLYMVLTSIVISTLRNRNA